ncbi:2OG-Fe(II) oxygenase family oxidoreductase [Sporormia fimetaria CBS 119925]|uniref:2OG-Fe(II) oxygenase family oxidoreductase n=1 Tax=Sporormia fimetaria CBS 119925 TaxID=1340428 RepID=A0A6A6VAB4_9PLEO|nr:2OG-Fe(II) oxygenase family oxidoreductase [Sporormia fimetaria CBS 119925]
MANMEHANCTSPDDIATLTEIEVNLLNSGSQQEARKLLLAAESDGFFYLSLNSGCISGYAGRAIELLSNGEKYFQKPLIEKLRDKRAVETETRTAGYKPIAIETGVGKDTKDGFEAFKVPVSEILDPRKSAQFQQFCSDVRSLRSFAIHSHSIANTIMASLSKALELEDGTYLSRCHRIDQPSSSSTVVNFYPSASLPRNSSAGHNAHTDLGSITILFCSTWGLQIYSDERRRWLFVPPAPTKAIINIGDTLRFLAKNRIKSCLHRVIQHPKWAGSSRLSLAYFARPNSDTKFTDEEGTEWLVEDWVSRKFESYRETHAQQRANWVQLGRKGFMGSISSNL